MQISQKNSIAFLVLTTVLAQPVTSAFASSCVNPQAVPIRFEKGKRCWVYEGKGTEFYGKFSSGQEVDVQMT
jgi:hypothetical protein